MLDAAPALNPSPADLWRRLSVDFGRVAGTEGVIIAAGVIAIVFGGLPSRRNDRSALRLLPAAWVVLLPALFAARGLTVTARHLLLVIPVVHWLVWWAVDRWWSGEPASRAWTRAALLGTALATIVVIQTLQTYRPRVLPEVHAGPDSPEATLVRWGKWLGKNAPDGTLVASDAPGALAYFGRARILDLKGRFTPEMLDIARRVPAQDMVPTLAFEPVGHPEYIVDRGRTFAALCAASPYANAFERLDEAGGASLIRVNWEVVARDQPLEP